MKIGLTYDLRSEYLNMGYSEEATAELDKEETIAGIENALQSLGYETERIGHVRQLMQQLLNGSRWDLVFNICEGIYGDGRESMVPALLDHWQIPYVFSGPATLAMGLDKAICKRLVRDAGLPTPAFAVVHSIGELDNPKPPFPLFIKPVSEGTGKGIDNHSLVRNESQYRQVTTRLLTEFHQPVLIESYLPGREFTVGIVGNGKQATVIGVMEVLINSRDEKIYSYSNKENYETTVHYQSIHGQLYWKCADLALLIWDSMGANDAGRIDIKLNASGEPEFMEINPLAGLNLHHSDLPILSRLNGISFEELIEMIMHAAHSRLQMNSPLIDQVKKVEQSQKNRFPASL